MQQLLSMILIRFYRLGMALLVGGLRFSEQDFMQTAAQLNTSVSVDVPKSCYWAEFEMAQLLTLAVIALIIPTAFAFALEAAVGSIEERDVILEM
jgi:Ca2+:H+ antiporter